MPQPSYGCRLNPARQRLARRRPKLLRPNRPNILFIFTDDQRWDTVAALGNPQIQTPNVDELVRRGFHFTNAYCMGSMVPAVCLPSRTMLITGRSLWRIPANPRAKTPPPGVPLLPALLNEAGYATFHCGKIGNSCTFGNAAFTTNIETKGARPIRPRSVPLRRSSFWGRTMPHDRSSCTSHRKCRTTRGQRRRSS